MRESSTTAPAHRPSLGAEAVRTTREAARAPLDARVLEIIARGVDAPLADAVLSETALALFAHQLEHNTTYRALCRAHGRAATPSALSAHGDTAWTHIPLVPQDTFKRARLAAFPPEATRHVFRTSGTTREVRGELHLDTLAVYEASLLATFRAFICPDVARIRMLVLAPSDRAAPDSSLSHMFGVAVRELGTPDSAFLIDPTRTPSFEPDLAVSMLDAARNPVAVAGTAFAFVHLLDAMAERGASLHLPEGSRVMETGGFKGRSRTLTRDALHGEIARRLGIAPSHIVNQYGMCELGSQLYEPTLRTGQPTAWKQAPPWLRTRALDPETLAPVPAGTPGVLAHYDLANTGSVIGVLTADLGRVDSTRVEVIGRMTGATPRGCSIAADALLGSA
jgi:hypothetical protein